ncbi:hypothetical protein L9F63_017616, partial [Diploptera punctata]
LHFDRKHLNSSNLRRLPGTIRIKYPKLEYITNMLINQFKHRYNTFYGSLRKMYQYT